MILNSRNSGGSVSGASSEGSIDRQQLSIELAVELMMLTMVVGQAMRVVMNRHGVDVGRINYQDNGNWGVFSPEGPCLHIHLYGRAKSAKIQKFGQACVFPHIEEEPEFYKSFKPLSKNDMGAMKIEIKREYQSFVDEHRNGSVALMGLSCSRNCKRGNDEQPCR